MNNRFLQFLGLVKKAGKIYEGYNKCEEGILRNNLSLVIISNDCSQNTKDKFIRYSEKYNVPLLEVMSKEELGSILGRAEINILGISDDKMSEKLISLWNDNKNNEIRG